MAWNPKTKIGKVLKTSIQVGGGILGLATGLNVGSAALGVVGRVVTKGTAALAKTDGVLSNISRATDKVATASKLLQAGVTKKYNEAVKSEKEQAAADAAAVAATTDETGAVNGSGSVTDFFKGKTGQYLLYGAAGLAALFLLPKLLKRR
jgi:predicted cobalt transporter CbtA